MREFFDQSGKINILIAVSLLLLAGFGLYLWTISKKVKDLENGRNR